MPESNKKLLQLNEQEYMEKFKKIISILLAGCEKAQSKGVFTFEESFEILNCKAFLLGQHEINNEYLNTKSKEFRELMDEKEKKLQTIKEEN